MSEVKDIRCKLTAADVSDIREIKGALAEYDYAVKLNGTPDGVRMQLAAVYVLIGYIAKHCEATINDIKIDSDNSIALLDLEDYVIIDIARGMVGLTTEEAKKSSNASKLSLKVTPAKPSQES